MDTTRREKPNNEPVGPSSTQTANITSPLTPTKSEDGKNLPESSAKPTFVSDPKYQTVIVSSANPMQSVLQNNPQTTQAISRIPEESIPSSSLHGNTPMVSDIEFNASQFSQLDKKQNQEDDSPLLKRSMIGKTLTDDFWNFDTLDKKNTNVNSSSSPTTPRKLDENKSNNAKPGKDSFDGKDSSVAKSAQKSTNENDAGSKDGSIGKANGTKVDQKVDPNVDGANKKVYDKQDSTEGYHTCPTTPIMKMENEQDNENKSINADSLNHRPSSGSPELAKRSLIDIFPDIAPAYKFSLSEKSKVPVSASVSSSVTTTPGTSVALPPSSIQEPASKFSVAPASSPAPKTFVAAPSIGTESVAKSQTAPASARNASLATPIGMTSAAKFETSAPVSSGKASVSVPSSPLPRRSMFSTPSFDGDPASKIKGMASSFMKAISTATSGTTSQTPVMTTADSNKGMPKNNFIIIIF